MKHLLAELIAQLSVRVRIWNEARSQEDNPKKLKDRDIVILEYIMMEGVVGFSQIKHLFQDQMSEPTVSNLLKELYKKGLITREPDPDDFRSIFLSVNKEGKDILEIIKKNRMLTFEMIVNALDLENEETKTLSKIIPKAIQNIDKGLKLLASRKQGQQKTKVKGAPRD